MTKDTKKVEVKSEIQETKVEMSSEKSSQENKKTIRRTRLQNPGPIYLDPSLKREGFRYRLVNDTPGRIEYMRSRGYEIVRKPLPTGSGSLDDPHALGSAQEVEVGKIKSQKAVWMEISDEEFAINVAEKEELAAEQDKMLGQTGIPSQYGKVTKEFKNS